jgi:hypothetical protein
MTDHDQDIPEELKAQLEELKAQLLDVFKKGHEGHIKVVRRTFDISTEFYGKLVGLDAACIAIAATVGTVMINQALTKPMTPELQLLSHWLVAIILSLFLSLISGIGHNFVLVAIAHCESKYSERDYAMQIMREGMSATKSFIPEIKESCEQVLAEAEKKPLELQQRNVMFIQCLTHLSTVLGYVSMAGFVGAFTLVAICTLRLWL